MSDTADASLVLARINPGDALHDRALRHLVENPRLRVTAAVGLEILLVARRRGVSPLALLQAAEEHFAIDARDRDMLLSAAQALVKGQIPTPFDAVHVAEALVHGGRLHTADKRLLRPGFPTVPF